MVVGNRFTQGSGVVRSLKVVVARWTSISWDAQTSTVGWGVYEGGDGTSGQFKGLLDHVPYEFIQVLCPGLVGQGVLLDVGESWLGKPVDCIHLLPIC